MAKAKKKAAPKKEPKKRAEQYGPKLSINGSFGDVIGVAMGNTQHKEKDNKK